MNKIDVELKEIENGWLVDDSYYGEETFFKTYAEAKEFAIQIFTKYQNEEGIKQ